MGRKGREAERQGELVRRREGRRDCETGTNWAQQKGHTGKRRPNDVYSMNSCLSLQMTGFVSRIMVCMETTEVYKRRKQE